MSLQGSVDSFQTGFCDTLFFHPENPASIKWDLFMLVLVCYVTVETPIRVAYLDGLGQESPLFWFDLVIDFFFFLDILKRFRTGILVDDFSKEVIFDPWIIAKSYLRGFFFFDLISCLPIAEITILVSPFDDYNTLRFTKVFKVVRIVRLAKLLKLIRLLRVSKIFSDVEDRFMHTINPGVRQLLIMMTTVSVTSHVIACGWYFVGAFGNDLQRTDEMWMGEYFGVDYETLPLSELYVASLYWAVSTLTSVGFGDIIALSQAERIYSIIVSFAGALLLGYIIGHTSSILKSMNRASSEFKERMDRINAYLKYRNVPPKLKKKITKYFRYYIAQHSLFDEERILTDLSHHLRVELSSFLCKDTISTIPLFEEINDSTFMSSLLILLKPLTCIPGDPIIEENGIIDELYFVINGHVVMKSNGEAVKKFGPGNYFGELTLSKRHERSNFLVQAATHCDLFTLSKKDFLKTLQDFPDIKEDLQNSMKEHDAASICSTLSYQDDILNEEEDSNDPNPASYDIDNLLLETHDRAVKLEKRLDKLLEITS